LPAMLIAASAFLTLSANSRTASTAKTPETGTRIAFSSTPYNQSNAGPPYHTTLPKRTFGESSGATVSPWL
jgi:hypothetical protein